MLAPNQPGFFRQDDMPMPPHWRVLILAYALGYFGAVLLFDIVLSPFIVTHSKRLWRAGARVGPAYQRAKIISGKRATVVRGAREWWSLRGHFEAMWTQKGTAHFAPMYRTEDGRMDVDAMQRDR
jgi:hypothetical protein